MKFNILVALIAPTLAFHASHDLPERASFGPIIPSAFFKFDSLPTLQEAQQVDTNTWLTTFLDSNFGLVKDRDYEITDTFSSHNSIVHVHLRQLINNIPVVNAVMNVNILRNSILSIGSSFVQNGEDSHFVMLAKTDLEEQAVTEPVMSPIDALHAFAQHIGIAIDLQDLSMQASLVDSSVAITGLTASNIPASLKYIHSDGKLILVWDLEVELENNWFNSHVDATTGKVVSMNDWVSHASYNVYPLGTNDPLSGARRVVTDPAVKIASPQGWHNDGDESYKTTRGNNVAAQENEGKSNCIF